MSWGIIVSIITIFTCCWHICVNDLTEKSNQKRVIKKGLKTSLAISLSIKPPEDVWLLAGAGNEIPRLQ